MINGLICGSFLNRKEGEDMKNKKQYKPKPSKALSDSLIETLKEINSQTYIRMNSRNLKQSERSEIRCLISRLAEARENEGQPPLQYSLNFDTEQYTYSVRRKNKLEYKKEENKWKNEL